MNKCIVTGATGHIGNVLVKKLIQQNRQVTVICLPNEDITPIKGLDIKILYGDITDREFIFSAIEKGSCVFHLAGMIDIGDGNYEKIYNVNVQGTINIVDACIENKAEKLIYTSSVHVIEPLKNKKQLFEPKDFNDIYEKKLVGDYAKTKALATKYVLEKSTQGLINAVVVYPAGVIGPYDYKISELGQVVLDYMNHKLLAYVKGGYNFVDVRDVVMGIINAEKKGRSGEGYILSGYSTSLKEMLKIINDILGRKRMPPIIALWFVRMFASLSNHYYKIRGKKPIFSAYSLYTLNTNSNFSHEKADQELDYSVRPTKESLQDAINWFLDNKSELINMKKLHKN